MCKVALCFLESAAGHFFFNTAVRCYSFVDTSMKVFAHVDEQILQIAVACVCGRVSVCVSDNKRKEKKQYKGIQIIRNEP